MKTGKRKKGKMNKIKEQRGKIKVKLNFNPISTTWLRDILYTSDGFSAIQYFPLLFKIGNGNVTI